MYKYRYKIFKCVIYVCIHNIHAWKVFKTLEVWCRTNRSEHSYIESTDETIKHPFFESKKSTWKTKFLFCSCVTCYEYLSKDTSLISVYVVRTLLSSMLISDDSIFERFSLACVETGLYDCVLYSTFLLFLIITFRYLCIHTDRAYENF